MHKARGASSPAKALPLAGAPAPQGLVGMSVEEMLAEWDYLTPAQVFSALAYYHDNREEIDCVRHQNSYAYWQEHDAPA